MGLLLAEHLTLRTNFVGSIFAACTFNFGPRALTVPHLDFGNLSWGWCAITALGRFDPDFGGHLILWDLRLVIRFPPGSTILIPSALIRHSNVTIRATSSAPRLRSTRRVDSSAGYEMDSRLMRPMSFLRRVQTWKSGGLKTADVGLRE